MNKQYSFNSNSHIALVNRVGEEVIFNEYKDCECCLCNKKLTKDDCVFIIKRNYLGEQEPIYGDVFDLNTILHFECFLKAIKERGGKTYQRLVNTFI